MLHGAHTIGIEGAVARAAGVALAFLALAACASVESGTAGATPAPGAAPASAATDATKAAAPAAPAPADAAAPQSGPEGSTHRVANPWAEPARDALVPHCGRCHRSDLDTSITGALKVFDLTEPIWYARLRFDQYDGILERVREASAIAPEDVAAVEAFVACARGGACPEPPR